MTAGQEKIPDRPLLSPTHLEVLADAAPNRALTPGNLNFDAEVPRGVAMLVPQLRLPVAVSSIAPEADEPFGPNLAPEDHEAPGLPDEVHFPRPLRHAEDELRHGLEVHEAGYGQRDHRAERRRGDPPRRPTQPQRGAPRTSWYATFRCCW